MAEPQISVVVPVKDRRQFLRQTILSLLADDGVSTEISVVDDGSTDGSLETIQDLPVRRIRLDRSIGVSGARNLGLRESRGRYITFFDSDDLLAPRALTHRFHALEARPQVVGVGGTLAGEVDDAGALLPRPCPVPPREPLTLSYFRSGGRYCCGPWLYLFRRDTVARLGGFDDTLAIASDSDLVFRLLGHGPIPVLPIPALFYRRHQNNLSFDAYSKGPRARTLAESFLVNACYGIGPRGLRA